MMSWRKLLEGRTQVETLLQWHTTADLEKAVLFYKRDKISQGVKFLASKGVIELHSNPDPRLWFDRTQHYLFIPETVNTWIDERFPPDRNSIVDKSEMPGKTLSSPSIVDKSEMHDRKIDDVQQSRKIDNEVEQRIPKNTAKKTTTTSVERSTAVAASASPVVVVSSFASEEDSDQEITNKLLAEFGEFSRTDARRIAEQVTHSRGYVLDAAEGARAYATSHRVRNRAGLFIRALKEGWRAPKASEPPKRQKYSLRFRIHR